MTSEKIFSLKISLSCNVNRSNSQKKIIVYVRSSKNKLCFQENTYLLLIFYLTKSFNKQVSFDFIKQNLAMHYLKYFMYFTCQLFTGTCLRLFTNGDILLIVSCCNSYINKLFYFLNKHANVTNFATENQ